MEREKLATIYRIPLDSQYAKERALFSLECTLDHRIFRLLDIFNGRDVVGVKMNHGAPSEKISPQYYQLIGKLLNKRSISAFLCDSSNRFKNREDNAARYMKRMFQRGYDYERVGLPFLMVDGADGKDEIWDEQCDGVFLAGQLKNLSGLVVTSLTSYDEHLGFKGALYNLGFGLAASRGKIKLSSMTPPQVNSDRCYYCRKCLHRCPTNAIYIKDRHVEIDVDLCINCGKCVDIAEYGGISYSWNATKEHFQNHLRNYAASVLSRYLDKTLFLNLVPSKSSEGIEEILIAKNPYLLDQVTAQNFFNIDSSFYQGRYKVETINY